MRESLFLDDRPYEFDLIIIVWNYYNSLGMETGYGLDGRGLIPGRYKRFFSLHSVHTGSGAHVDSYPMSTGGSFPESNAVGV
jgi:hypothetical protein